MDIDEIYHRLTAAGDEWAEKHAIASQLEETQKPLLSQLAQTYIQDGKAISAAEHLARASDEYKAHVTAMVEARREANKARVAYDSRKTWSDLLRTKAANLRAERKEL